MLAVMESLNGTEKKKLFSFFFSYIQFFPLYTFYIQVLFHPPVQHSNQTENQERSIKIKTLSHKISSWIKMR